MAGSSPPPTITIRTVRAQMATERESSKFRLAYRGGKLQFGLDKLLTLLQRGKALSLSRELLRAGGRAGKELGLVVVRIGCWQVNIGLP